MLVNLKGIFTPQAVAGTLTRLPDLKTTVLDTAFPQRPIHPFASVGLGELTAVTGTMPVVRRSGQPVTVASEELEINLITPLPIKPAVEVTAAELNDLRTLLAGNSTVSINAWRDGKIDLLRRLVRDTTEAMASVVLYKGKVDWPQHESARANYVVDYGATLNYVLSGKLTGDSKVSAVFRLLTAMRGEIRKNGIGGKVAFHAGTDVFMALMDVCQGYASTAKGENIRVDLDEKDQGVIRIGGYSIMLMDETYKHPKTGEWVEKLNPKALVAFSTDVPGKIFYCAIDSISAQNASVPFHVVAEALPGDSGIKLFAQSKPLPARNSKSTCTCLAVA
jgi:hypothetical protein